MTCTDASKARYDRAFGLLSPQSDAVIIVPPFADIDRPSLGVHLLQAAAEQAGLRVRVFCANLLFATLSGEELYKTISDGNYGWMWGERIFAAAAFGLPPLGYQTEKLREQIAKRDQSKNGKVTFEQLAAVEREAGSFCCALGERFSSHRFRVLEPPQLFTSRRRQWLCWLRLNEPSRKQLSRSAVRTAKVKWREALPPWAHPSTTSSRVNANPSFRISCAAPLRASPCPLTASCAAKPASIWIRSPSPASKTILPNSTMRCPPGAITGRSGFLTRAAAAVGGAPASTAPFADSMARPWPSAKSLRTA